jgi:hypothetical protein
MHDHTIEMECSLAVEFRFHVDRGLTSEDDDTITDLRATITGPKGETLQCPRWLADLLLDDRTDYLYDAVREAAA